MSEEAKKPDFAEGIIIDKPSFKSKTRNLTEWSMSIFGWILWFFLFRPFVLLITWVLGYDILYVQMYKLEGYKNIDRFLMFGIIIASLYVLLRAWNVYNAKRFRGKDRRKRAEDVDVKGMADFFETTPDQMQSLQECRSVDVVFLEKGEIRLESDEFDDAITATYDPQNQNDKIIVY